MVHLYSFYRIYISSSKKSYIGITRQKPEERLAQHIGDTSKPSLIHKAIRKYGKASIIFQVLFTGRCTEAQALIIESQLIDQYKTLQPNGYNQVRYQDKKSIEAINQNTCKTCSNVISKTNLSGFCRGCQRSRGLHTLKKGNKTNCSVCNKTLPVEYFRSKCFVCQSPKRLNKS